MRHLKVFITARNIKGSTCVPVGRITIDQANTIIHNIEKYRNGIEHYSNTPCWIDLEYSDIQYEISNSGTITKSSRYISNDAEREFFDIKTTCQKCNLKKSEDCLNKILKGNCKNTLANKLLWTIIFPDKYTKRK